MMSCMKVTREELRAGRDGLAVSSRAVHVQGRCRGRGQRPGEGPPHLFFHLAITARVRRLRATEGQPAWARVDARE